MAGGLEGGPERAGERLVQTGLFAVGGAVVSTVVTHPIATAFFTAVAAGVGCRLAHDLYDYTKESCCKRRPATVRREEAALNQ